MSFRISADPNDRSLSRKLIVCSANRALGRLQTDYVDMRRFYPNMALDEAIRTTEDLVWHSRILYTGVRGFSDEQIASLCSFAAALGAFRYVGNQSCLQPA